jgi:hypothetical protein
MRALYLIALLSLAGWDASQQETSTLPELHVIKSVSLSPSYSCRPPEEFQKGYAGTALFLSDYSRKRNSPDLLFNGACRSADEFQASTAGDDMALLADLGESVPLESLTANDTFNGYRPQPASEVKQPHFSNRVAVKLGHTYAALINKSDIRGLLVFTVTDYTPNRQVVLRYAVKEYQISRRVAESAGFDWSKPNSDKQ